MLQSTKTQLSALALYQVLGGVAGIVLTLWVLFQGDMVLTVPVLRLSLFACGLFVFSILCGVMLWRKPLRGLTLSLINQVLQVLYFSFGAYSFQYVAGLRLGLGLDMAGSWTIKFRMAISSFQFIIGSETSQKFIGINLVALFLIFWIERLMEKQVGRKTAGN
ncbi:hypothetical protein FVR03_10625 [Pontibacter qinzhouensis]|uniref:Uncharacterized protein n=1 Tax=Pontibacter qinzhouensis TaxID=2603253 RepID=A0A5C8K8A2_9BACT|nr:hypothetical protein [Pontibacter qinzhouensis]TXK46447.1 hypothetical protein FVR03_10625 [Pontibacter qinzhouensis]